MAEPTEDEKRMIEDVLGPNPSSEPEDEVPSPPPVQRPLSSYMPARYVTISDETMLLGELMSTMSIIAPTLPVFVQGSSIADHASTIVAIVTEVNKQMRAHVKMTIQDIEQ